MSRGLLVLAAGLGPWLGCGDDDAGEPGPDDTEVASLADALTHGMRFTNGTVKLGALPASSDATVALRPADSRVQLVPGGASLLGFEVEGPADGEPVEAVLLQFADAERYIEIEEDVEPSAEPVPVSLDFTVDDVVCDGLCAAHLEITLTQAVRLADGTVSETAPITIELDCTARGEPDACGGEPAPTPDAGSDAGKPVVDAGTDAGPPAQDVAALAAALSTALAGAHDALCTSCSDASRVPCYAIAPLGAITCIESGLVELTGTPELVSALETLTQHVQDVTPSCASCDFDTCAPSLLDAALASFPPEAMTVIEGCVAN